MVINVNFEIKARINNVEQITKDYIKLRELWSKVSKHRFIIKHIYLALLLKNI